MIPNPAKRATSGRTSPAAALTPAQIARARGMAERGCSAAVISIWVGADVAAVEAALAKEKAQ